MPPPPEDINKYPLKVMFPEIMHHLQMEILNNHPQLWHKMKALQSSPLEERIAAIATYCDVLVDGWLDEKGLEVLCELLLKKLKEKSIIVIP